MDFTTITYDIDGPVATITLNRPDVLNAISRQLEDELSDALRIADEDEQVRAIVLTGAGRAFSAGYDMAPGSGVGMPGPDRDSVGEYVTHWYRRNQTEMDALRQIWTLGTPVIAAINGYCMGGGFWYTLACDISLAADDAVFGQPEVRGISSTTFLLAALVGWKAANRYGLTGDHFDAAEALRLGIVNEVVPAGELLDHANALARRIAKVPEPSVRINKAITMLGLGTAGVDAGLALNGALNALVHSTNGPERRALEQAKADGGLRAMLKARDEPFLPEPFGPRSESARAAREQ